MSFKHLREPVEALDDLRVVVAECLGMVNHDDIKLPLLRLIAHAEEVGELLLVGGGYDRRRCLSDGDQKRNAPVTESFNASYPRRAEVVLLAGNFIRPLVTPVEIYQGVGVTPSTCKWS